MEIRALEFEDYDSIINVWKESGLPFKPYGRDSRENIRRQMSDNHVLFLGAFEKETLIGVVIVNHEGRKGWINRLAVLPSFQRKGVASQLVKHGEKWFEEEGIKIWAVLIEDYNDISKKLFQRLGYTFHDDIYYYSKRESDKV